MHLLHITSLSYSVLLCQSMRPARANTAAQGEHSAVFTLGSGFKTCGINVCCDSECLVPARLTSITTRGLPTPSSAIVNRQCNIP